MSLQMVKGYAAAIFSGVVLVAMVVIVVFQWANVSKFSLFGYSYDLVLVENKMLGGVNTALLMLLSAIGGVAAWHLLRLLARGMHNIAAARQQQAQAETQRRLVELEKAAHLTGGEQK